MNNQSHSQLHYTLPGVMHYLQTEFTKNERDRIAWELERAEMKARIAQLEGENKDLHHEVMKLAAGGSSTLENASDEGKVSSGDLTGLLKSKMAVQESVKEIIYLFKSPNVATQMNSLNGMRDPIHELQNLNLNQNLEKSNEQPSSGAQVPEINLQKTDPQLSDNSQSQDLGSDADTVVMGSDSEGGEPHEETRRRRSSSLFTSVKVAPVESMKGDADHSEDLAKISSLFQNNETVLATGITRLKALGSQVLSYSQSDKLKLWQVDPSLHVNKDSGRSFQGVGSALVDFYWLDSRRFLVFDDRSVKLYSVASESPIVSKEIPTDLEYKESDLIEHDYTNNWFLFVFRKAIKMLEFSSSSPEKLLLGESCNINAEREVLSAKFGMTEKSLIVLYNDPFEIVIYTYRGKVLQRIDVSKQLESVSTGNTRPLLILNKKSSKLMIALGNRVLVYSFDEKKFVLNNLLDGSPISIIFKTAKDTAAFAFEDGNIDIRSLKDFGSVTKWSNGAEFDSQVNGRVKSIDSTIVNSTPVIVSGHNNGTITVQKITELTDG